MCFMAAAKSMDAEENTRLIRDFMHARPLNMYARMSQFAAGYRRQLEQRRCTFYDMVKSSSSRTLHGAG